MTPYAAGGFLTVMTYNVRNGLAPPDRLANLLRHAAADVVGLQELAEAQAAVLNAELASLYPYQVLRASRVRDC